MNKTKQGNRLLDMIEPDEIIEYIFEHFYDSIRDGVLDNEQD